MGRIVRKEGCSRAMIWHMLGGYIAIGAGACGPAWSAVALCFTLNPDAESPDSEFIAPGT
jgi:hypothetical protein